MFSSDEMVPICPHCGREAPIVYKGVVPTCTACGAMRAPLSSTSVNMAGKPSKVGGTFASVLGWLVLVLGESGALAIGLIGGLIGGTPLGLALGLPIALVVLVAGIFLLRGGRALSRSGEKAERSARDGALLALAAHRGAVTAYEAAQALGLGVAQADAMLTELAKREPDRVAVDVDDAGVVWYRVSAAPGEPIPRLRVDAAGPRIAAAPDEVHAVDEVESPVATRAPR
jgi:hypothetical protein